MKRQTPNIRNTNCELNQFRILKYIHYMDITLILKYIWKIHTVICTFMEKRLLQATLR